MAASYARLAARSVRATETLTEAAPASADDGVLLENVDSVVVAVIAPGGQTFTGAGTLLAYVYVNGTWRRYARGDLDMSDVAGLADGVVGAVPAISRRDRMTWIASAVALSGAGAQLTIDLMCTSPQGERF